jgi:peptide chain release factor subunit 1
MHGGVVVAITEDEIRSLASFQGGDAPVTSCYLDVDGHHTTRQHELVRAVELLIKQAQSRYRAEPSVGIDLDRVLELVRGGLDRSRTRGLAVFSCAPLDLWRVVELPVPVRNQITVNHSPAVRQLEQVIDQYERFGLLLADKQRARVLVYELGELVHSQEVVDPLPRAEDDDHSYRRDKADHHVSALVHQHLRRSADAAFELYKTVGFEHLILGGPDELVHELEALLHPYLKERLEGRCSISVGASEEETRAAALAVEASVERRKEAEVVERLREAAGAGRRGVAGLEPTLRALVDRRVETLVVSAGFTTPGWRCTGCGWIGRLGRSCPVCATPMAAIDDIVEEAVEEALAQSCEVEMCDGNADLDVLGRIGALLRY